MKCTVVPHEPLMNAVWTSVSENGSFQPLMNAHDR